MRGAVVAIDTGVAVTTGVGEEALFSSLPQADNTDTIKSKTKTRAMNLYHRLLFGHMMNHLLLQHY